jgi:hypothetical protein
MSANASERSMSDHEMIMTALRERMVLRWQLCFVSI